MGYATYEKNKLRRSLLNSSSEKIRELLSINSFQPRNSFVGVFDLEKIKHRIRDPVLYQFAFLNSGIDLSKEEFDIYSKEMHSSVLDVIKKSAVLPHCFLDYVAFSCAAKKPFDLMAEDVINIVHNMNKQTSSLCGGIPIISGKISLIYDWMKGNKFGLQLCLLMSKIGFKEEFNKGNSRDSSLYPVFLENFRRPLMAQTIDEITIKSNFNIDYNYFNANDLVNRCVNNLLTIGSMPSVFNFFVLSNGLSDKFLDFIINSFENACEANELFVNIPYVNSQNTLLKKGAVSIFGSATAFCDADNIVDGKIDPGDIVLGLPSSGPHTNGFSHISSIFDNLDVNKLTDIKFDRRDKQKKESFIRALNEMRFASYKNYSSIIMPLVEKRLIKSVSHITGGGITGSLKRILPKTMDAVIGTNRWKTPIVFDVIFEIAETLKTEKIEDYKLPAEEMFDIFNMGIGMAIVVSPKNFSKVMNIIESQEGSEGCWEIGKITEGKGKVILN